MTIKGMVQTVYNKGAFPSGKTNVLRQACKNEDCSNLYIYCIFAPTIQDLCQVLSAEEWYITPSTIAHVEKGTRKAMERIPFQVSDVRDQACLRSQSMTAIWCTTPMAEFIPKTSQLRHKCHDYQNFYSLLQCTVDPVNGNPWKF